VSTAALGAVRASLAARRAQSAIALTVREREVLEHLPSRRTLSEIGDNLYVSTATVKTHVHRLYGKLGVNDRQAAVERAVALGLLA
jgi:LuxR family maltose regulon positive regulatory protein